MVLREFFVKLGLSKDETSFATAFATVELLKTGLEAVAEMAGEAKRFLVEQISATVEAGVQAKAMAESMGLQVDQFQRLQYAAQVSEVPVESLQMALRQLTQHGVRDLGGHLLALADRFEHIKDPAQKSAIAIQEFGFRGAAMVPLLNKGRAGIEALMQEAGDLGVVMSGEDIEATEHYMDAQHKLGAALAGLRNTVFLPMLGTLTKWLGAIVEAVKAFREWYAGSERLAPVLKLILATVIGLGIAVLANAAITAIATVGWSGLAFAIGWAATEAWEAVAAFLAAAAPWLLLAAAIAAVILVVQDIYTFIEGGDSIIARALHKWLGPFKDWREAIKIIWGKLKAEALHIFDGVAEYFNGIWAKVIETAKGAGNAIVDAIEGAIEAVPGGKFIVEHLMGGGAPTAAAAIGGGAASPAAAALGISAGRGGNRETHTTIAPVIHVHAAAGMSEGRLADHVADKVRQVARHEIREHHDAVNRETAAATG